MTAGWEGILDDGETILWQGCPDTKIVWQMANVMTFLFGLLFAGFALFWMVMASFAGGFFWMFGLIHFGVGISISFGAMFLSAFKRRRLWYTLTNQRAFIASEMPFRGRKLSSYPITEATTLDFIDGAPASIHFASQTRRGRNRVHTLPVGFERIEDGRSVYRLIRNIQEGAA